MQFCKRWKLHETCSSSSLNRLHQLMQFAYTLQTALRYTTPQSRSAGCACHGDCAALSLASFYSLVWTRFARCDEGSLLVCISAAATTTCGGTRTPLLCRRRCRLQSCKQGIVRAVEVTNLRVVGSADGGGKGVEVYMRAWSGRARKSVCVRPATIPCSAQ